MHCSLNVMAGHVSYNIGFNRAVWEPGMIIVKNGKTSNDLSLSSKRSQKFSHPLSSAYGKAVLTIIICNHFLFPVIILIVS